MTGDAITAKKEHQKVFATWKTADPDLSQFGGGEEGVFRSPVTSVASFNFLRRCYGANALTVVSHAGLSAKPRTGYLKEFTGIPHLPPPTVPSVKNDARF
jgi:hypothetical protein